MKRTTVEDLTIDELASLTIGKNVWHNEDLNGRVPIFMVSDGPVGVRHPKDITDFIHQESAPSIAYPCFECLSQTWDLSLAKDMGAAIAVDCIEKDIDMILGPGCNIKRLPTCGRNFEYLSEDPLIAGLFAREYINGVQEKNVGACLKHYCANNSETSRNFKSSDVDERTLREIYLKPFEIACEAKPYAVMCSYNLVNGVKMSEHKNLYNVLRNEFLFDGMVFSDWCAVFDRSASLAAGLDLEMPYDSIHLEALKKDLRNGIASTDDLKKCASRVLDMAYRCFENKEKQEISLSVEERYEVAKQIALEGAVLLKNENQTLPLKKEESILVTGVASEWYPYGGGSSEVPPREPYVKLEKELEGKGFDCLYHRSIAFNKGHATCIEDSRGTILAAATRDISIISVGDDNFCEAESYNRQTIALSKEQVDLIKQIAKVSKKTLVLVYAGAAIDMKEWIDDVSAVVFVSYGGEKGNVSLAKLLSGEANFSGKLTETFPLSLHDVDAMNTYEDASSILYQEGLMVGYRQFLTKKQPVLFPFGYGLSYSSFYYSNLGVNKKENGYDVTFEIENQSEVDGTEVSQVYVSEIGAPCFRPVAELKGFSRDEIGANRKKTITIFLPYSSFMYFSEGKGAWRLDKGGVFDILVGPSCTNLPLKKRIVIDAK